MVAELRRLLLALPSLGASKWVFPNTTNTGPESGAEFVRKVFEPALIKAGIHKVTVREEKKTVRAGKGFRTYTKPVREVERNFRWKELRHTFATWLRQKGEELATIGALLGHRVGSRMTLRYAHLTQGHKHAAVRRLDGLVRSPLLPTTDPRTDARASQANTTASVH